MINFIFGIIIGSAFAPFWMKLYEILKAKYYEFTNKK